MTNRSESARETWVDLGPIAQYTDRPLREISVGRTRIALSYVDGVFGAISGLCNHVGGPLGEGRINEAGYVVCPWHNWTFHCRTGFGEPGYEDDRVPGYRVEVRDGNLWLDTEPVTRRNKLPHDAHPLARRVERADGPPRVLGISTTVMDTANPRFSTSDELLETALAHAATLGADTQLIRLRDLSFRACEGYYSKSARACTWPCSITQMDSADQLDRVYEGLVHWADVIVVATPIRWGAASSLYYKMVERMNCIQNQITLQDRVLMRGKVASFVITGGQDNIQAVAGQMLGFFAEIGCTFPPFPYIAHSRGWSAEDMERNVVAVQQSKALHEGAHALVERAVQMARALLLQSVGHDRLCRGGRKAFTETTVE
jgi:nitrite reductase/ring-hydroxylating ferredoxin subunit/multimeric flavodoxin WrbA